MEFGAWWNVGNVTGHGSWRAGTRDIWFIGPSFVGVTFDREPVFYSSKGD